MRSLAATCLLLAALLATPAAAQIARTIGPNPQALGDAEHDHGYKVPPPESLGGSFALEDHTGRPVTDKTLLGKWALLYFGYTTCKEACPTALGTLAAVLDRLGETGERIQPVFVDFHAVYSRMPHGMMAHATRDDLASLVGSLHPRLIGLTGTRKELFRILRLYKVRQEHSPLEFGRKEQYMRINHTTYFYLLGPNGKVKAYFYHDIAADELAAAIKAALAG